MYRMLFLLAFFAFMACDNTTTSPENENNNSNNLSTSLDGGWVKGNQSLIVSATNHYYWLDFESKGDSEELDLWGKYSDDSTQIFIQDIGGPESCGSDTGNYSYRFGKGAVTYTKVKDQCNGRPSVLEGTWTATPRVGRWWRTDNGKTMHLTTWKDRYELDLDGDGSLDLWGHYSDSNGKITINDDGGHDACDQTETGVYSYSISEPNINFTTVSDECQGRPSVLAATWTRE